MPSTVGLIKNLDMSSLREHLTREHVDFAIAKLKEHEDIKGIAPQARWLVGELEEQFPTVKKVAEEGDEEEDALRQELINKLNARRYETDD
jgi:hypothetical protein